MPHTRARTHTHIDTWRCGLLESIMVMFNLRLFLMPNLCWSMMLMVKWWWGGRGRGVLGVHRVYHDDAQFKMLLMLDLCWSMVMLMMRSFGSPGSCHETYAAQWSYWTRYLSSSSSSSSSEDLGECVYAIHGFDGWRDLATFLSWIAV